MKKGTKYIFAILFTLFSVLLLSCSEPTMEEDAQKAADLTSQSNQYSMEDNYKDAGRAYEEVQEIMTKYKRMGKFDEFYLMYSLLLQDASYSLDDENLENMPLAE